MDFVMESCAALRKAGERVTDIRKAILDIAADEKKPLSFEDFSLSLEDRDIPVHKATIYRELAFLSAFGLLTVTSFKRGVLLYEANRGHHHHLVCNTCEKILDVEMDDEVLRKEQELIKKTGFTNITHSLEFFGVCAQCS